MASHEGVCHSLDDEHDEVMEPPLDEFDMWQHQQEVSGALPYCPEKRAVISQLQKSFLDQLHSDCDLNAAAAKALLTLKGASPSSSSSTELPQDPVGPDREFVIFDDDDRSEEEQLDAFDLLAHRSAAVQQMDEQRQQLVAKMQAKFLDALEDNDVNGAAAVALKKLVGPGASKDPRSQKARELFQALFQEHLVRLKDPNAAAACALRTLAARC
eukprot:Skav219112  [mRNA]  locus=scaffold1574:353419:356141:+ [translate_table: standard]